MRKDLKKNKKGFTLVEIIVVLLIIGILLAITIPSIMGYVGKAKDAQLEAEARSGYVAAQTIVARKVAGGATKLNNAATGTNAVTADEVKAELNDEETITAAGCAYNGTQITKCAFKTKSSGTKAVEFIADTSVEEPTKIGTPATDGLLDGIYLK